MEDSEVNRLVDEDAQLLHSRLQASCSLPVARLIVKKFTDFSSDAWGSEEERDEVLEMAYDWCTTDDGRRLLRVAQQLYSGIENHKLLQVAKVIADVFPEGMAPEVTERVRACRSEEHTSELQSLMRISYAVFCLKKKKRNSSRT